MSTPRGSSLLGSPAPIPAGAGAPHLPAADDAPEYADAVEAATRLLAASDKTRAELATRLTSKGFPTHVVELVVDRLQVAGVVDDEAYARRWVAKRRPKRASGSLIVAELEAKGVERAVAEAAVEEAGDDEVEVARELAVELAGRHARLTPARQAARIQGALARRGFSEEIVEEALRAVLPPEGWD